MDTIATILKDILEIGPACRGEVSEFWVERTGKDGRTRRHGPYHVLRIRGMIIDGIHAAYWTRRGCLRRQTA